MRFSIIPADELPLAVCESWITANINLCWTSAKSWEMEQVQVCGLCELHNRAKAMEASTGALITELQSTPGICRECGGRVYRNRQFCTACLLRPKTYARRPRRLKLVKG